MSPTTRTLALALALMTLSTAPAAAQEGPFRRIFPRFSGRNASTYPASMPAASPAYAAGSATSGASDPMSFASILNSIRARAGLPPLAHDPGLSSWASSNNAAMCRRGLGHHVVPGCSQNCGWNYSDAQQAAQGWLDSPGHRANMLSPSATHFGIAYGPGPYWTLNLR